MSFVENIRNMYLLGEAESGIALSLKNACDLIEWQERDIKTLQKTLRKVIEMYSAPGVEFDDKFAYEVYSLATACLKTLREPTDASA